MYDLMRKELQQTHMANKFYVTVHDCPYYEQFCTHKNQKRQLKMIFSDGPPKYIGMDILRPLPRTKQSKKLFAVTIDRYNKLTKDRKPFVMNATSAAPVFWEQQVAYFGIASKLPTDNGPRFVLSFFFAVHNTIGLKKHHHRVPLENKRPGGTF